MKLQPYIDYKESEIEWLKRVPKYWEVNRIKDIAFLKSGDTVTSSQLIDPPGFPVYGGNGFRGYFEDYNLEGHYILIGRQGALCGNINLAKGKFWASEHAIVVHPTKKWEMIWFSELLSSMNLNQYSLSAAQPGLSVETIRQLKIPFPPLSEQTRIANYLDRQTQLIDRKIELLQRKRDYYEELKQALINETVCRGLDKNAPLKDSGVEWIGKVPAHWEVKRLKDVGYLLTDKMDNRDQVKVGLENIVSKKGEYIETDTIYNGAGVYFTKGDILFGKLRPYLAKVYLTDFKGIAVGDFFVLRAKKKEQSYFIYLCLMCQTFISQLNSSTFGAKMPRVNWDYMSNIGFPIPPEEEEAELVKYLRDQIVSIAKIESKLPCLINTLQELRKTLINDVVTGKVRVPETN